MTFYYKIERDVLDVVTTNIVAKDKFSNYYICVDIATILPGISIRFAYRQP